MFHLIIAAWCRTAGLSREEGGMLAELLKGEPLPTSVDQAWTQLEAATLVIRRRRAGRLG